MNMKPHPDPHHATLNLEGGDGEVLHITHLKQPEGCRYSVITVASPQYETYRNLSIALANIYIEGYTSAKTGSALDALIIERFAEIGCGVAPCHATDNFSRKRGRIMAEGRMLKLQRNRLVVSA